jgi:hypothetical protein
VLFESCRAADADTEPAADASFTDILASLGIKLQAVPRDHDLLLRPHLFSGPPPGFETKEAGGGTGLLVADGVIFSRFDYGCLWRGERRDRLASREEIRTAMEWGGNIVAYALHRRTQVGAK